jgi:hypothetical protein
MKILPIFSIFHTMKQTYFDRKQNFHFMVKKNHFYSVLSHQVSVTRYYGNSYS